VTFVQTYPLFSATLLVTSIFILVVGFVAARRRQRSLNPIFLFLPIIAMTLIALAALPLFGFGQSL
jgi:energy-converting hydrogenase Eha subunit H